MTVEAPASAPPHWWQIVLIGRRPRRTLIRVAVLVVTCFIVFRFFLLPIRIQGASMLPNYHSHALNCLNRLAYRWHMPRRGDVVGIRFSDPGPLHTPSVMLMKRVVGLPGETVEFRQGRLFINGQPQDEPYVKYACNWERPPQKLGPDEYFVVGDNRSMSLEDHKHGATPRDHIVGKVLL